MLSFILYKDLHISALQITAIVALKPMSSLLAPYWTQAIYQRPDNIISNLVWANIFRYLPFLFLPWIDSAWLIIAAFGIYMTLYRAAIPAWMEIFKWNLPEISRERAVGYATTINYCGTAIVAILLGVILDRYEHVWRWLFVSTAVIGLGSTWLLYKFPFHPTKLAFPQQSNQPEIVKPVLDLKKKILQPWKRSWELIKGCPDFAKYQVGFMFGGAGLMITQPALPVFFVDTLNLSYLEVSFAIAVCKGVGVAISSPFWTRLFRKIDIYYFSGLVTLLSAVFTALLLLTPFYISILFIAYILYGIMQSGSELSWHMSGLVFSKEKESSAFSSTNVITVGIRGCVIPALGAILLPYTHSIGVMILGICLCLTASWHLMRYSRSAQAIASLTERA